jgi:RNA polymerase sigma-70 factor (ECF subfamily)
MPASHPPVTAPSEPSPSGLPLGVDDDPTWGDESAVFELRGSRPPPFGALDVGIAPRGSTTHGEGLAARSLGTSIDALAAFDSLAPLESFAPLEGLSSLPPLESLGPRGSLPPLDSLPPLESLGPRGSLPPLDSLTPLESLGPRGSLPPLDSLPPLLDSEASIGAALDGAGPVEDVGQLFSSYRGYVAKIGRRILGASSEVDDLIQDVFLATVRDVHKVKDPARFRAWLATVTTRMAKRRRFRSSTHPISCDDIEGLDEMASDPGPGPESTADLSGNIRKLLSLPDELRTPWLLKHVEGHTLEDVAKRCDCSLSTAARRIQTVNNRLQRRR